MTTTDEEYGPGCNGGVYSSLKYAKKSEAWRRDKGNNTTIYTIEVIKDSFFPKKVRKPSNLIISGEIVGKKVLCTQNGIETVSSVRAAKYGRRTAYIKGYRVVQTDYGYAAFFDGYSTQFITGLPVNTTFKYLLQAIA